MQVPLGIKIEDDHKRAKIKGTNNHKSIGQEETTIKNIAHAVKNIYLLYKNLDNSDKNTCSLRSAAQSSAITNTLLPLLALLEYPKPSTMLDNELLGLTDIVGTEDDSGVDSSELLSENTYANEETSLATNNVSLLYEHNSKKNLLD